MIKVGFKRLTDDAILPVKAHPTDSGFDLFANEDVILEPGGTKVIKTGIAVQLPSGHEAQVRPRSGVTSKTKLRVQLGTIDNGYSGEVGIIVDNVTSKVFYSQPRWVVPVFVEDNDYHITREAYQEPITINKGDKLAQLVIQALPQVDDYEIDVVQASARGSKGFGSSGY